MMNCIEMLKQFIKDRGIENTKISLVEKQILGFVTANEDNANNVYDENVLAAVIIDSFKLNAENLKMLSDFAIKCGLQIGRRHKKILLRYLNYRKAVDKDKFYLELAIENAKKDVSALKGRVNDVALIDNEMAFQCFLKLWNSAVEENDEKKQCDYLFAIYSRLHAYYNESEMSLDELYDYNAEFIGDDLGETSVTELENYCKGNLDDKSYYDKYVQLLRRELQAQSLEKRLEFPMNQEFFEQSISVQECIRDRGGDLHFLLTEEYDAVYLRLNQDVFDTFKNAKAFYNYVLDALQQIYRILINNKVVSIEIDNIYDDGRNIKWLLYAYVGVYAERFIKTEEKRKYYSSDKICFEMFKVYGITYREEDKTQIEHLIRQYYKGTLETIEDIYNLTNSDMDAEAFSSYLDEWKYVYYGFSYNDCYVIKCDKDSHQQYMNNVENDNKLLYVFYKYRMDERKTPCPVCNGLDVSGNSYSEIGHRSWECKNVICKSRSKSNRGKRYSFKTNYMQFGSENTDEETIISKEMIAKWRKDIAVISSDKEIYSMFLKYFSFPEEKVLFINCNHDELGNIKKEGRRIQEISLLFDEKFYCVNAEQYVYDNSLFDKYFLERTYLSRFIREKKSSEVDVRCSVSDEADAIIFNGDSYEVLQRLEEGSVAATVTSPPYFNAREYSQWENMYIYLYDMYNITRELYRVLDNDGVYLYNIGDINGNEMTIAKSNMGNKRLLLGAYSILIFEAAGFELVDNYIWNKGEPQSKRSTNDGNFTPHYQKPVNCYEHMFIFKKRGETIHVNEDAVPVNWRNFVVDFTPVYKINSKGENTLGHTAPYPEDIPDFVAKTFGKKGKAILDPFLGSGTSIIAAVKNRYKGYGIEFSKEYAELARKRFDEEIREKVVRIL